MKLKRGLVSVLMLGIGMMFSGQVFAASNIDVNYSTTINYELKSSENIATIEAEYKDLFIKYLKEYAGVDASQIPQDAKWEIKIKDRASIIKQYEELVKNQEAMLEKDKTLKDMYEETLHNLEQAKKDTYDEITCKITYKTNNKKAGNKAVYNARFNADTKGILFLKVPDSDEALEIEFNDKKAKVSAEDYKEKYAALVVRDKIGGIEEVKDVTKQYADPNQPIMIFEDKNDSNKKVTIYLDGSNGNFSYISVW